MDFIMEEYKILREEIKSNISHISWILSFAIIISTFFFTIAFSEFVQDQYRFVFFCALYIILFPLIIIQKRKIKSIAKIGRYIEYAIESEVVQLNWETYTHLQQKDKNGNISLKTDKYHTIPIILIQMLSIIIFFITNINITLLWIIIGLFMFVNLIFEFFYIIWPALTKKEIIKIESDIREIKKIMNNKKK